MLVLYIARSKRILLGQCIDYLLHLFIILRVAWGDSEPNNLDGLEDCVMFLVGVWSDITCLLGFSIVCEKEGEYNVKSSKQNRLLSQSVFLSI